MFWFICLRSLANKTINEIMPSIDKEYTLTQTRPKKYSNIEECLLTEILLPKAALQKLFSDLKSDERWETIKNKDLTEILKNPKDTLTEDERFAIVLYSYEPYFYTTFSQVLHLGTTGQFNCFFQYLRSGFDKIKNYLNEETIIYRGVGSKNLAVDFINYNLGDTVCTTSFTSTTLELYVALNFSSQLIFEISAKRNPKSIMDLSFFANERELLFPPLTKFVVSDELYGMWCVNDLQKKTFHCDYEKITPYYRFFVFVPLEEVDEDYGPILTVEDEDDEKDNTRNSSTSNDDVVSSNNDDTNSIATSESENNDNNIDSSNNNNNDDNENNIISTVNDYDNGVDSSNIINDDNNNDIRSSGFDDDNSIDFASSITDEGNNDNVNDNVGGNACTVCKYKNVPWWGWLLIGVAVAACVAVLICLVVFLVNNRKEKKEKSDEEIDQIEE